MNLVLRSLVAVLVLPGVMGFAIPLVVLAPDWRTRPFGAWGALPLVAGSVLLVWCVREFHVAGRGTLAPWSPPVHLVTTGPYRWSRNPMYVAMTLIIAGWAIALRSPAIGWYLAFMIAAFHARILLGEEPRLARAFGAEWAAYRARTPRWMGRVGPPAGTRET